MRTGILLAVLAVSACGEEEQSILKPGTYSIQAEYTRDDWPGGEVGKTFESEIKIKKVDSGVETYNMEIVGSSTKANGIVSENIIYFVKAEYDDRCGVMDQFFDTVMIPDASRKSFSGYSNSMINLCNVTADGVCTCGELWFSVDLEGTRK